VKHPRDERVGCGDEKLGTDEVNWGRRIAYAGRLRRTMQELAGWAGKGEVRTHGGVWGYKDNRACAPA